MTLHSPTRAERTGKQPHIASLEEQVWPEFMYHDAVLDRLFGRVVAEYPEFLFYAWDDEREEVVVGATRFPQRGTESSRTSRTGVSTPLSKQVLRRVRPSRTCSLRCRS